MFGMLPIIYYNLKQHEFSIFNKHKNKLMKNFFSFLLVACSSLGLYAQHILYFDGQSLGNINNVADQASGIVWLSNNQDVWVHNDYWMNAPLANKNKIFKLDLSNTGPGVPLSIEQTITINESGVNTNNIDWEDITKDENNNVYIGNFGDNNGGVNRILKISNPNNLGNNVTPEVIYYQYPLQNGNEVVSNTEAMFYFNGQIYLFSKIMRGDAIGYEANGYTYMFKIPNTINTSANPHQALLSGSFKTDLDDSGNDLLWRVTGADISPDKKMVALLCQSRLWLFTCFNDDDFLNGAAVYADFYKDGNLFTSQKEGVAFADNQSLYISEDGQSTRFINIDIDDLIEPCTTNSGNCNMVENSEFNGNIGWQFYESSTATASWNTNNDIANVNITDGSIGKWKVQLFQNGLNFEPNKIYSIQFDAKADQAKEIYCKLSTHDDAIDYDYRDLTISNTWQTYSFYFTMNNTGDSNGRLTFGVGKNNININFDEVYVKEASCGADCTELIRNGYFSNTKDNFNLFVASDAAATWYQNDSGEYVSIKITDGADKRWKIQMSQTNIPLEQNKTYRLQFRARADSTKTIYVKMSDTPDVANYFPATYLDVSDTWENYEFTFTMNEATDLNARLNFAIGQNEIAVRFDDISLLEEDCGQASCLNNLVHVGNIETGNYQVIDYIQSTGTIQAGEVTYRAHNNISLQSGFSTNPSADFKASIDGCQ